MSLVDRFKAIFNRFRRGRLPEGSDEEYTVRTIDEYKQELRQRDQQRQTEIEESKMLAPDENSDRPANVAAVDLEQELKNGATDITENVEVVGPDGKAEPVVKGETHEKPIMYNVPVDELANWASKVGTDEKIPDNLTFSNKSEQPQNSSESKSHLSDVEERRDAIRAADEAIAEREARREQGRYIYQAVQEVEELRQQREDNNSVHFTRKVEKTGNEDEISETEHGDETTITEEDTGENSGKKVNKEPIHKLKINKGAVAIAAVIIGGFATIGVLSSKIISKSNDECAENSKTKKFKTNEYVVCYDDAIKYDKIVETMDVGKVKLGEILVFQSKDVAYYDVDDNKGIPIKEEKNFEHSATNYKWVVATKIDDHDDYTGYVPIKDVDLYYQYKAEGYVQYRSEPSEEKGNDTLLGVLKSGNKVWVCKDEIVSEPGVQDGFYKALYQDKETGEKKSAYVKLDNLIMQEKSNENFCIAKKDLSLKTAPIIQKDAVRYEAGTAKNGEIYKVKESIEVDGNTWYKCGNHYIAASALKPISDFDKDIVIDSSKNGVITSKNGNIQRAQVVPGAVVKVDTDKVYDGKYQVFIDEPEKNIRCTGYMDAAVLGLPDKIEQNKQPLNYARDGYCYIINVDEYKHKQGFIETIEKLKENNLLGGIMFCVGKSNEGSNANSLYMEGFADDQTDFLSDSNDETVLNQYIDEIKSKFNNGVESIVYDDSLGSIKRLEEFIQEASGRDIPVGFYYSQCCTNPNRASAEAGYVYGVTQKIKSDMGSDFDKVYQLPYMEDVGPVSSEIDYNEDRTTATIGKLSIMATGQSGTINYCGMEINEESPEYFWTIGGVNKAEGYHLMDPVNNQFIYRTAIIPKNNISLEQFARTEQELAPKGIKMDVDGLQIVTLNRNLEALYERENPYEFYNTGITEYRKEPTFSPDILERADVSTFLKDFEGEYGFSTTLGLTSKKTIEEMCNGTYAHTNTFTGKLDNIVIKNIESYEPER